jgi:hypothetical protein
MNKDPEVLSYLLDSMLEASGSLDRAVAENKIEESSRIKKTILDLNKKISEELK